jgi:methanogenic corrinoid protein MtbC1
MILEEIRKQLVNLDLNATKGAVKKALEQGISAYAIITRGVYKAMEVIRRKIESREYSLAELIIAYQIFKECMGILKPKLAKEKTIPYLGKIIIGSVEGDFRELGKDQVKMMLDISGFKVYDLGVNVLAEEFVKQAKKARADIIALSAALTTNMLEIKQVIERAREEGIRDKVRIIIGGSSATRRYAKATGADAYGEDAIEAVRICEGFMGKRPQT